MQTDSCTALLADGLSTTPTNVNFDDASIKRFTDRVRAMRRRLDSPGSEREGTLHRPSLGGRHRHRFPALHASVRLEGHGCLRASRCSPRLSWTRTVDELVLHAGCAALTQNALRRRMACPDYGVRPGQLSSAWRCWTRANTAPSATRRPTRVHTDIKQGPFIVVSGHDLEDLHQLLEQTKGTGVNVYTHCEMLPAHGYPELNKYPQLAGNFGTAWQSQQKEFEDIPAPGAVYHQLPDAAASELRRTGSTPPRSLAMTGLRHIEADEQGRKDFSPLIRAGAAPWRLRTRPAA